MYDGKMPLWHHWKCFFEKKNKLQSISEIANFDNLRWEDQEKIKKKLAGGGDVDGSGDSTTAGSSTGGSSKNSDFSVSMPNQVNQHVEACGEKIPKGEVRISVLDDNPEHQRYGPAPLWRHVDCFVKDKQQLGFNDSADNLPGFNSLKVEDQKMVKEKVGSKGIKRKSEDDTSTTATKVKKTDLKEGKTLSKEEKILKEQNRLLFDMRDKIAKSFSKKDMIRLLEHNEQHISAGEQRLLDHLADCLVFGALKKCPECKSDAPRFMNNKYVCNGNLTEWTKCQFETKYPERKKFDVPEDFQEDYPFLKDYKCVVKERKFPKVDDANSSKKNLPLSDFKISLFGKFKTPQDVIQKQLEQLGAKIQKSVNGSVNLCISTPNELQSESSKIEKARSLDIHIVSYGFVDAVKKGSPVAQSIKENLLSTWGEDPILKYGIKKEHGQTKSGVEKDQLTKSIPQKVKVTVKGAAAVDPESGLEDTCHVYQKKDNVYNVVLAYVDMSKGTNSFYKLQILESNKGSKYYVFRQWGRVGTTIGGKKVEKFSSSEEAVFSFKPLLSLWEKTERVVFKINRHGEKDKYKKFKDLHNKKLLWHGSRLTNYVGILSQGLRIAPPEAPVTGYMFGKGVYFADMVSKSANYCFTSKKNNTGLLLLCEVALGDMYERTKAEFVEKLPSKKHSTLGMGMTVPDPNEKTYIGDVEIPYGKPTQRTNISRSDLLYNEYIVYDTNQINIKYLLKVEFKYVR
ncbi:Poly [ADP-ribose] polymerase like protein [Argiope bruennichi]|uniref:Poly [ADP-ribose] polymerase n=1 Tax=Argiope bruennichi TaxID=94029 RepID=A0A8T0EI11_ARGBR|nr:Poly [ADP-ribose] polymerase like protein [Argiope bruennichi]